MSLLDPIQWFNWLLIYFSFSLLFFSLWICTYVLLLSLCGHAERKSFLWLSHSNSLFTLWNDPRASVCFSLATHMHIHIHKHITYTHTSMSPFSLSRVLVEHRTTDKRIHRRQYTIIWILHNDWSVYLLLFLLLFFFVNRKRNIYFQKEHSMWSYPSEYFVIIYATGSDSTEFSSVNRLDSYCFSLDIVANLIDGESWNWSNKQWSIVENIDVVIWHTHASTDKQMSCSIDPWLVIVTSKSEKSHVTSKFRGKIDSS